MTTKPDRTKAPQLHPFSPLSLPEESVEVLPGGATLHMYRGGDQPTVTLNVLFDGGSENLGGSVLSSIYSQTVTEGSATRTPLEVSEALDFYGARYSPTRTAQHTGFRLGMLVRSVAPILDVMADVYRAPRFGDTEVAAARTAAIGRIKYLSRQMNHLAAQELGKLVCGPDHPSAHKPDEADVEAVTPERLRQFHTRLCAAKGCNAYLSGMFDDATVEAVKRFLDIFPDEVAPVKAEPIPFVSQVPQRVNVTRDYALQSAVGAAIPEIGRNHPHYHYLRLTVMALGGYFGSRLMSNIREEKGLTYGISAALLAMIDGAYASISAQCSNDNVDIVIDEIRREMIQLVENPPRGEELERLRMHAYTEALETLDSPEAILNQYMMRRSVALPHDYFARQQQAIASLTPEIIADMASRYLKPDELRIAVAGA